MFYRSFEYWNSQMSVRLLFIRILINDFDMICWGRIKERRRADYKLNRVIEKRTRLKIISCFCCYFRAKMINKYERIVEFGKNVRKYFCVRTRIKNIIQTIFERKNTPIFVQKIPERMTELKYWKKYCFVRINIKKGIIRFSKSNSSVQNKQYAKFGPK